jgi:hypothetical protein
MLFKCSCHSSQHVQSWCQDCPRGSMDGLLLLTCAGPSLRGRRWIPQLDLGGRPAVSLHFFERIEFRGFECG